MASNFMAAKELADHCGFYRMTELHDTSKFEEWQKAAARDCVMSLYHFGRTIEGIDKSLSNIDEIRKLIDTKKLKEQRKKFLSAFPDFIDMRNAIAHSAERMVTKSEFEKHSGKGIREYIITDKLKISTQEPDSRLLIIESLFGDEFKSMWEGKIVSCNISESTYHKLYDICEAYRSIFDILYKDYNSTIKVSTSGLYGK